MSAQLRAVNPQSCELAIDPEPPSITVAKSRLHSYRIRGSLYFHRMLSGSNVSVPGGHSAYDLGKSRRGVRARESSRNCLDCSYGVHRIPPDWPGPANFQQPLNYGRIPRSSSRISPCHHVHSPGGAATKTCFDFTFHRTNPAELGQSPRKPRLRSEVKQAGWRRGF